MAKLKIGRREFLLTGAAGLAATSFGRVAFAARKADQARPCRAADRTSGDLFRTDSVGRRTGHEGHRRQDHVERRRSSAGNRPARQPVQSQPRRRSRQEPDPSGKGRPDAGLRDAGDGQSGRRPMRNSPACPACRTTLRSNPISSAGTAIRKRALSGPITSSSAPPIWPKPISPPGTRSPPTR